MSIPATDPQERIIWRGNVSQWHYAGKWIFICVLIAAVIATFFITLQIDASIIQTTRIALAMVAAVTLFWILLDRAGRKYTITNKRVSVEFGIISKQSNEVRIQDIRSINLRTKGMLGLLGIGTVEFSSAATDDADVVFWNTPGAAKIRDTVRNLQS